MARKGKRTGIFDLKDVTKAIQLSSFEGTSGRGRYDTDTLPKLMLMIIKSSFLLMRSNYLSFCHYIK